MKATKSNMNKDFAMKDKLRQCYADGGLAGMISGTRMGAGTPVDPKRGTVPQQYSEQEGKLGLRVKLADGGSFDRAKQIESAVNNAVQTPKPAAAPAAPAGPTEDEKDAAAGIHIPKPVATPPPQKKGLFGLGVLGLRDGGMVRKMANGGVLGPAPLSTPSAEYTRQANAVVHSFDAAPAAASATPGISGGVAPIATPGGAFNATTLANSLSSPIKQQPSVNNTTPFSRLNQGANVTSTIYGTGTDSTPQSRLGFFADGGKIDTMFRGSSALRSANVGWAKNEGTIAAATAPLADDTSSGAGADMALAGGGKVNGPGGPTDDKIPAMLSHGEYVLPADTVKHVGVQNLDNLRAATHTPVAAKAGGRANGGLWNSGNEAPPESIFNPPPAAAPTPTPSNAGNVPVVPAQPDPATLRQGAYPAAPKVTSAFQPGDASTLDARDLRVANLKDGTSAAATKTVAQMDADQEAALTARNGGIQRDGNSFFGQGDGPTAGDAANRQEALQKLAGDKASFNNLIQSKINAGDMEGANQLAYDDTSRALVNNGYAARAAAASKTNADAALTGDLRNMNFTQRQSALEARGQNMAADTAAKQQQTARDIAGGEQGVQSQGQNLTYQANMARNNLDLRKFGLEFGLNQQKFGLDQQKEGREAGQQNYKNLTDAVTQHSLGADGKTVDPDIQSDNMRRLSYTAQQMGIKPGDFSPDEVQELLKRADFQRKAEAASTGILNKAIGSTDVEREDDLRKVAPTGQVDKGIFSDSVKLGTGTVSKKAWNRGDFSATPNFGGIDDADRKQQLEGAIRGRLRSPNP